MASSPASRSTSPQRDLFSRLRTAAKYKERSSTTHDSDHVGPLAERQRIECLLLGDSMLERFKTTGCNTPFGAQEIRYPEVMNCGVGGDHISNVIYRLVNKDLLQALKDSGVDYVMLEIGTNDLVGDKHPLSPQHIESYKLLIEALKWASPDVRICVCALCPRGSKRLKKQGIVEESNDMLRAMVGSLGDERVEFIGSNPDLVNHLADGVHLDQRGYEIFGEALWSAYQNMRKKGVKTS
ncbi:SGNH hydrolase [Rhizodiscina lignyota]|uniref:SGNH hydrolase n=1 Tax=Rhizodiscina lignyota TaxID=1504668 RepID=A0A9P4M1X0_9PEZI|nr:SGNH hydrolase [Rhizodiscina lignyota]